MGVKEEPTQPIENAYSYVRLSSKKQVVKGAGAERQLAKPESICQLNGWTLSTDTFSDLGVSSFHGLNRLKGALGEFIKCFEGGKLLPNPVLIIEHTQEILKNANYEFIDGERIISGSSTVGKTKNITRSLIDITTKDYIEPKYNVESDGRLINSYTMLANDVKNILTVDGMVRKVVVDIRACHPTFFSSYILKYYAYHLGLITTPVHYLLYSTPPTSLHYVTHISDNNKWNDIKREHERWLTLFLDEVVDPRSVIGSKIDESKEYVKEALNATLNGSKKYPKVRKWLESEFPNLFQVWQSLNPKETGIRIGRNYEGPLMLDTKLYQIANEMGLKIRSLHNNVPRWEGRPTYLRSLKAVLNESQTPSC